LKRVVEISRGSAASGESVYVFSCADGSTEISGFSDITQRDIASVSRLWQASRIDD
jgi:hypothetical protein